MNGNPPLLTEQEQDPAPGDICVLFSLPAVVHSGKCMFNSFTIHGVMRTMNMSEGIIASPRGAGEFKLVGTWTLNQARLGLATASPTMAPITTKLPGKGVFSKSHSMLMLPG